MSDEAREAYRVEQKSKMDNMAREKYMLEEGMKLGIKEGIKEGIKKGIKEGEIKKAIEAVVNLISATKMSIYEAMKILKVDSAYKTQIENELEKRGIKYDEQDD